METKCVELELEKAMLPTERERRLVELYFSDDLTEDAIRTVTRGFSIDTEPHDYLLLLSCVGFSNGWNGFFPGMVPRLKGLHLQRQTHIALMIPWVMEQVKKLTDEGISVMFVEGMAMLAYYDIDHPRQMWDYDLMVHEEQFDRAVGILSCGCDVSVEMHPHFASIKNGGKERLLLHRRIFKTCPEKPDSVWERAVKIDFYGVQIYVPCGEDMFIYTLDDRSRGYFRNGFQTRMRWVADCCAMWKVGELNLSDIARRADELHIKDMVRFMLRVLVPWLPELIPQTDFDRCFPHTPEYDRLVATGWVFKELHARYTTEQNVTGFSRILLTFRLRMAHYHYVKADFNWQGSDISFIRHIKTAYHINSLSGFIDYFQ